MQPNAPATDFIVWTMKAKPDELTKFSKRDAKTWMDRGLSENVVREYLNRERERRGI